MIIESITVSLYQTNCYVAGFKGGSGVIIDPGDDAGAIMRRVKNLDMTIRYILLTHGHLDHIGALKAVKEATNAPVAVHSADAGALRDEVMAMLLGMRIPTPPEPDMLLGDGQKIEADGITLTVIHTPGHSLGGICLLGDGFVFSGDTLFQGSIGRTDLPGGSYEQIIKSIKARLLVLPDDTVVYPGHGPPTTIGEERRYNPFLS